MAPRPKQVFLFDMTRHRSHLFFRYLSTHPDVQSFWHPFLPAFLFGPERITQFTKNSPSRQGDGEWAPPSGTNTYADVTEKFLDAVQDAAARGKILVANEHCQMVHKQDVSLAVVRNETPIPTYTNPTVIPDSVFASLTPIFIIRNPVFAVPSNYVMFVQTSQIRPGEEDWKLVNGVQLQRRLFDHFREKNGYPPLVVDGDDVVWRTKEVSNGLCHALGINLEGLSDSWEARPENQRSNEPILRAFLQTIDDSTGIERLSDIPPNPNIDSAYDKWVGEYGKEIADQLKLTADGNMQHYEYLRKFKI